MFVDRFTYCFWLVYCYSYVVATLVRSKGIFAFALYFFQWKRTITFSTISHI